MANRRLSNAGASPSGRSQARVTPLVHGLAAIVLAWSTVATGIATALPAAAAAQNIGPVQPVQPVPATLTGIACPTTTMCVTVGYSVAGPSLSNTYLAVVSNGVLGPNLFHQGPRHRLDSVACPTATTCEAVGTWAIAAPGGGPGTHGSLVVTVSNGSVTNVEQVEQPVGHAGIACPSATTCYSVGSDVSSEGMLTTITDGVPGSTQPVPGTGQLSAIACPDATRCVAVGLNGADGVVVNITNGVPGTAETMLGCDNQGCGALFPSDVSCGDATHCEVVATAFINGTNVSGIVPINSGVPGAFQPFDLGGGLSGVACVSATTCEVVGAKNGTGGFVATITNSTPEALQTVPGAAGLDRISCASATTCVAVGRGDPPYAGVVVDIGLPITASIACSVTKIKPGPPRQAQVTVLSHAGLASIADVEITNGAVAVPKFTPGTKKPVVVTATKTDQSKVTTWQFVATDILGDARRCA